MAVIKTFADKSTEQFWRTGKSKGMPPANLRRIAYRKLTLLDLATTLDDLKSPPGNCLKALHSDRAGQHSIRINDQFRVCFKWKDGDAYAVEVTDYH